MLLRHAVITQGTLDLVAIGSPEVVAQQVHRFEDRQRLCGRPARWTISATKPLR